MSINLDLNQKPPAHPNGAANPLVSALQLCPLFNEISDSALKEIAEASHLKTYERGDILCHAQDVAHTLWLIISPGWVKLTRETLGGAEAVWDVLGMGTIVGLESLSSPYQYNTASVAVSKLDVIAIPHSLLRRMVEAEARFALIVLGFLNNRSYADHLEMEHRTQQTAAQRIGCFLLRLAATPLKGSCTLHLPFDKGLLAARLGMQPETFSRGLARLKADTSMKLEGATVTIPDVATLNQYVCGNCSGSYPCKSHP